MAAVPGTVVVATAPPPESSVRDAASAPPTESAALPVLRVSPLRPEARSPEFLGPYGTAVEPAGNVAVLTATPAPTSVAAPIAPAEPVPTYLEPAGVIPGGGDRDDEPPLPDEATQGLLGRTAAATVPVEAAPGRILHVHLSPTAGTERLVGAMEEVRSLLRERPGQTRVVVHLPQGSGQDDLPMELRNGVAYDADLLAELSRRLATGIADLRLA